MTDAQSAEIGTPDESEPEARTQSSCWHRPTACRQLSVSVSEIRAAADVLAAGTGPFAIDAERASGFRYSNRAYLVQIRRAGAGSVLIDPVNHGADPVATMAPVAEVLAQDEWVLHAADQDLPCLAELGMTPTAALRHRVGRPAGRFRSGESRRDGANDCSACS